jgi:hypothetical protein
MIDKRLREIKAKRKRQWGDGAREIQREKQRAGDVAQWQSACLAVQGPRLEPQPLHTHTHNERRQRVRRRLSQGGTGSKVARCHQQDTV